MKVKSTVLGITVVIVFFSGIILTMILNYWTTESSKQAAVYTRGEFEGEANPEDIRGSYSFGDVSDNFYIPVEVLAEAFDIESDNTESFLNKDLEIIYAELTEGTGRELGNDSVKLFVSLYKGVPYTPDENTILPHTAVNILLKNVSLTEEQITYINEHSIDISGYKKPGALETAALEEEHEESEDEDTTVKGKTTFADLINWGLEEEEIKAVLGMDLPLGKGMTVRDFCIEKGLEFTEIKTGLQEKIDSM
jgi:hypothetical protein